MKLFKFFSSILFHEFPVAPPRVTRFQIVCGDCGGDELLPRKTFMCPDGRCAGCAGRSHVPAAILMIALQRTLLLERQQTNESAK